MSDTTAPDTDRIEEHIVVRAPLARVWRAISDHREFGHWFGVDLEGPFVAGAVLRGKITPTKVDPEVAKMQEPHAGKPFEIVVDTIEPERRFSFRWHPFAIEPGVDYAGEPHTLVSFTLAEVSGGTRITPVESGFDGIPLARRARAFSVNEGGWQHQLRIVARYVDGAAA